VPKNVIIGSIVDIIAGWHYCRRPPRNEGVERSGAEYYYLPHRINSTTACFAADLCVWKSFIGEGEIVGNEGG